MKPRYIVVCGGEGSGKTSAIKHLATRSGLLITREPGGSPFAEIVRRTMFHEEYGRGLSVETMFFLMWASRMANINDRVAPALASGQTVVSDRGDCCTYAYQIGAGKATHLEPVFWNIREACLIPKPDLYVFFDVDVEIGIARVNSRRGEGNFFDEKTIDFHRQVRAGYMQFLKKVPHVIVDANQSAESVRQRFAEIVD